MSKLAAGANQAEKSDFTVTERGKKCGAGATDFAGCDGETA
jgi:hypothetical protein